MAERHCLRTELRENLYRPLWGSKKQSSSTLDGVVRCFPSEASVGPLTRPSGLSRAQQLIIFDTLKIFFLPSFCSHHGGVALDRAFPLFGGSHLWSTLLLRVKAQKCVQDGGSTISEKLRNVGCGENYCLSLKTKARFGSKSSLEASMETDDLTNLRNLVQKSPPEDEGAINRWDGIGGRIDFTHKFDLYKLLVSYAFRERFQTHGSALSIPSVLSTEVISNDLHGPFHYRIGLHQILDVFPNAQDVNHDCANAVYFQGGFGIDGVATLLKSSKKPKRKEEKLEKMRESTDFRRGFIRFLPMSHRKRLFSKPDDPNSNTSSLPSSATVLKSLGQQITSLRKASDQLSTATKLVKDGKLKSFASLDGSFRDDVKRGTRLFLPGPHLKVGGLVGVVSSFGFHKDGLDRINLPDSGFVSPALIRRRANLRWKSTLDETPVKAFIGCSMSAQIGRMKHRMLSFTSALAQFECSVPISIGQTSLPRRIQTIASSQRSLMLGNLPLRPLVNFSFVQQAIGPVRVKADYRVALESTSLAGSSTNLTIGNALLQQVQSIRPCVMDAQFGVDFVVPGTQGAIKLGAWFSPSRKEAMAELRMF